MRYAFVILPILHMSRLSPRDVTWLVQGHGAERGRGRKGPRQSDPRVPFSILLVFKLHSLTFSFSSVSLRLIPYNALLTGQTILYQSLLYRQKKTFILLFWKHTVLISLIAYAKGPWVSLDVEEIKTGAWKYDLKENLKFIFSFKR